METSKNHLIRIFLRNGRLRVNHHIIFLPKILVVNQHEHSFCNHLANLATAKYFDELLESHKNGTLIIKPSAWKSAESRKYSHWNFRKIYLFSRYLENSASLQTNKFYFWALIFASVYDNISLSVIFHRYHYLISKNRRISRCEQVPKKSRLRA